MFCSSRVFFVWADAAPRGHMAKTVCATAIVGLLLLLLCTVMAQDEGGSPWVRYTLKQRCYRHVDMFGATTYPCFRRVVPVTAYRVPRVHDSERRQRPDTCGRCLY